MSDLDQVLKDKIGAEVTEFEILISTLAAYPRILIVHFSGFESLELRVPVITGAQFLKCGEWTYADP